ncbi:MAG: ankyrin repeat domain-containing protein [Vicinamibacterales bacterium]
MIQRLWRTAAAAVASALIIATAVKASDTLSVADAAMTGDRTAVIGLLKAGADVNATQGDAVTALHWAARLGDAEMTRTLIAAGANARATTRFAIYAPLHLAAERGSADVIATLLKAGADANAKTATGATPMMFAASSGNAAAVTTLADAGADLNGAETDRGQTPLMFAVAANRLDVVHVLLERGADANKATRFTDLAALSKNGENPDGRNLVEKPAGTASMAPTRPAKATQPGVDRQYHYNEQVYAQGGMTPLHYAARQGFTDVALALLDGGVPVNQAKAGDRATALLIATINGHFDFAARLLERGANPNLIAENGATPLYAAINLQWAPRAGYPQPHAQLNQQVSYLDYMKLLLDKGADPNARVRKKVWYTGYNFDQSGVDEVGATAFWRAAYGADVEAMRLLMAYGADPNLGTVKPPERPEVGDAGRRAVTDVSGVPPVPVGGAGVPPLLAAAGVGYGEGFAGNSHRFAPIGQLAAVKYLVEAAGADVNARDHEGHTAMHHAAARGDTEMLKYLVSKGADPKAVNREGQTTIDMANGPVQRTQPYPETIAYLESLGVVNNHKCMSC